MNIKDFELELDNFENNTHIREFGSRLPIDADPNNPGEIKYRFGTIQEVNWPDDKDLEFDPPVYNILLDSGKEIQCINDYGMLSLYKDKKGERVVVNRCDEVVLYWVHLNKGGYGTKSELINENPDYLIESPLDLLKLIL